MQKKEQSVKKVKKDLSEEKKDFYEDKKEAALKKEEKKEEKTKEDNLKKEGKKEEKTKGDNLKEEYKIISIKNKAVLNFKRFSTILKETSFYIKETTFFNAFKLFISTPKNILLMFLVDFIFLAAIMLVNGAFNYMFTKISVASSLILLIIIPVALINLMILILVYTFTKKKVLDIMFSYKNKISFETPHLKKFYLTNLIFYFIVFLINVILSSALTYMIKPEYKKTALIAGFVVVFIFAYLFINLLHLFFCQNVKQNKEITHSFIMAWNAMSKLYAYKPLIISLIIFLIYSGIISLIGVGASFIIFKFGQNMKLMSIISISIFVLSGLVAYLMIIFNRIYYLELVEKEYK